MSQCDAGLFVVGTRRVKPSSKPGRYRVVCAACGAGGSVEHETKEAAMSAAVRDSVRACKTCGAE